MFTPANITKNQPNTNDRPYAGWGYFSSAIIVHNVNRIDTLECTIGVVGKHSYAESTQKFVHKTINSPQPHGWNKQLSDELGIILGYNRSKVHNLNKIGPFETQFITGSGFEVGNVFTNGKVNSMLRIGWDLPFDYGVPRISPAAPGSIYFNYSKNLNIYFFIGAEGKLVLRNIFLDGNSFRSSPRVRKKLGVGELETGVTIKYRKLNLSYSHVYITKEFKTQRSKDSFGSLSLSIMI